MSQSMESKNKALVLEAFDTLFNKRDYPAAERFWSSNYRPKQGLIKIRTTTLNQDDEAVLVHVLNLVVLRRKDSRQEQPL
jgi:hypothetical protein